jgi:hypothetical protein
MITHIIGSLHEADAGWQSADTIKLNFRFWARAGKLRLTSMSRHRQHDRLRPKSAMKRLMHRSNYLLYSITWSARSRNDSGIVRPAPWRLCD